MIKDIPSVRNFSDAEAAGLKKIVIAVHGFGGSKDDRTIAALSAKLKESGNGLIAFDLPGHGDNKSELRIENCLKAIGVAADYAKKRKDSRNANLNLMH